MKLSYSPTHALFCLVEHVVERLQRHLLLRTQSLRVCSCRAPSLLQGVVGQLALFVVVLAVCIVVVAFDEFTTVYCIDF